MPNEIVYVYQIYRGVGGESGQRHTAFYHFTNKEQLVEETLQTLKNGYKGGYFLALRPVDGEDISEKLRGLGIHHDEETIGGKCLLALVKSGVFTKECIMFETLSFP